MISRLNSSEFADAFRAYGRADNFSYEGLRAMFYALEDVNPEWELDVIALCCDYAEYDSAVDAALAYGWDMEDGLDGQDAEDDAMNYMQGRHFVLCSKYDGNKIIVGE